jgi:hypothetical protein
MAGRGRYLNQYTSGGSGPYDPEEFTVDQETTLRKDDLLQAQNFEPIRQYMIERKGVDYQDKAEEEVVDDFVEHMRFFNANVVSTAGEARFISNADDRQRQVAGDAYQLYDQLGNVFVNDGLSGAVSGVGEYMKAIVTDPTNYIGLVTGGIGRVGAAGVGVTGRKAIQQAVRLAGRNALRSGANQQAARAMANNAAVEAARRFVSAGASSKASGQVFQKVAEQTYNQGRRNLAKNAMREAQEELFKDAGRRSLKQTVAIDSLLAVTQDVQFQNTMLQAGAQEEYSKLQTGFSAALGGVAGIFSLAAGRGKGVSGLGARMDPLERAQKDVLERNTPPVSKANAAKAGQVITKAVDDWATKVARGNAMSEQAMPVNLVKSILFGEDNKSGLAKLFVESGYKMPRKATISDVITNVALLLPEQELNRINAKIEPLAGFTLGDLAGNKTSVSDFLAKTASDAGKNLNAFGQLRKLLNTSLMASNEVLNARLLDPESQAAIQAEKDAAKADVLSYGQSVWKRLLVSSPATTALNVAGYAQFSVGQATADLFGATGYVIKGLGQGGPATAAGKESLRKAHALVTLQGQKIANLMDPFTTYDTYMEFLESNQEIKKRLFATISDGIDSGANKFNIDPNAAYYKKIESVTITANQLTGVRIQDSFTKSQMYMTEIDKQLRLEYGMTLKQVMQSGDEGIIDDKILSKALGTTLESVFSTDYTTKETPELIRKMASLVETVSNVPGLGTILPFGRFFNNVLAYSYKWSPFAVGGVGMRSMKRLMSNKKLDGTFMDEGEAFSRAAVGTTFLFTMAEYDNERREKGLAYYEMEGQGGTIIDAKNTFPLSMYLAAARWTNLKMNGESIPRELNEEMLAQLAVGQLAKDAQFSNDLLNIMDAMSNGGEGGRGVDMRAFAKISGNMLAGVARPLDAVNRVVGYITGDDVAKDIRQAEGGLGTFTQTATKYFDNIIEAFIDKTDTITGEELRVATREGDVYDANPFARIFGINVKQGRTATEKVYSMTEMHPWQASERTRIPAYDRVLNEALAPVLERQTQRLLDSRQFRDANLNQRRSMLRTLLTNVRRDVRRDAEEGVNGNETMRLRLATIASRRGSKEVRTEAMKFLNDRYGVEGKIEDLSYSELRVFMDFVDLLQDNYQL